MRTTPALAALALFLALPAAAFEATPSPVTLSYAKEAFQAWSVDTGWMPETGPVQVRFIGFVGGGMNARCGGATHLSWPQSQIWATGDDGAGQLTMDLGVELQTYLHLDLDVPNGPHFIWEGPIPLIPGFDYRFAGTEAFTPFLLEGQQPAFVGVSDSIQQTELYSLSLTDMIIPIPGIEGAIEVSAGGLMDLLMRGARVSFPEGDQLLHGGGVPVSVQPGAQYQTSVGYAADVMYQGTLLLQPAVVIHLGPLEWDLVQFDLPFPLPQVTETWSFAAQPASFQLPRLQASVVEDSRSVQSGDTVDLGTDRSRTVRLSNASQAAVSGAVSISGAGFSAGSGTLSLQPGESIDIAIYFQGDSAGDGSLLIHTNDPAGPISLFLHAAEIVVTPPADGGTGTPDSGTSPAPDAGTSPVTDAGTTPRPDAGGWPTTDGGTGDPDDDLPGGCSCAAGTGSALPFALLALLALAVNRARRGSPVALPRR